MLIGIISDTHDALSQIEKAVKFLNAQEVELVLHAGDYIAPFSLMPLAGLKCPWQGVFGNNDGEKDGLSKHSQGRVKSWELFLEFSGRTIFLRHEFLFKPADIIIFGHTHKPEIKAEKGRLFINPGEVCGYLTKKPSLALLDLEKLKAEIVFF